MNDNKTIKEKTIALIDSLKSTCQTYGMGNDGNEYKIITQVFLYKFLNDKFGYEVKKLSSRLANAEKWEEEYTAMSEDEREDLLDSLSADIPKLYPEHLISTLWNQQTKGDFELIFDSTRKKHTWQRSRLKNYTMPMHPLNLVKPIVKCPFIIRGAFFFSEK